MKKEHFLSECKIFNVSKYTGLKIHIVSYLYEKFKTYLIK